MSQTYLTDNNPERRKELDEKLEMFIEDKNLFENHIVSDSDTESIYFESNSFNDLFFDVSSEEDKKFPVTLTRRKKRIL